jgi:hypothetical protein
MGINCTIPHDDLSDKISQVIDEAWLYQEKLRGNPDQEVLLQVDCGADDADTDTYEATWFQSAHITRNQLEHTGFKHPLTKSLLKELVKVLLDNIYVVNGGQVIKQILGIPMGTNCAPLLANLYLYWYESHYIDKLCATDPIQAQLFHMTFRYIDDVLSADNPHWSSAVNTPYEHGGIYPTVLKLNDTSLQDGQVIHYVGTTISSVNTQGTTANQFILDVFNKRSEFPFDVRLYPHMCSLIPTTIPYGVYTGQLYRFAEICSSPYMFINQAVNTAKILIQRGCKTNRLIHCFENFLVKRYNTKDITISTRARYLHFNYLHGIKLFRQRMRGAAHVLPSATSWLN